MTTTRMNYNWSGALNGKAVDGQGAAYTNTITGRIQAHGNFNSYPDDFDLLGVGVSWFCICCSNSFAVEDTSENIVMFTGGNYKAERFVSLIRDGNIVGQISISANVISVQPNEYTADVKVDGQYAGPIEVEKVGDYWFNLNPDGQNKASGKYAQSLFPYSGRALTLLCEVLYEWSGGAGLKAAQIITASFDQVYKSPQTSIVRSFGFDGTAIGMHDVSVKTLSFGSRLK